MALLAGFGMLRRQSSTDAVARANDAANITAMESWKQIAETERLARIRAEERADKFAEDRNLAWAEVYKMRGQIEAMTIQIETQSREIAALRDAMKTQKVTA